MKLRCKACDCSLSAYDYGSLKSENIPEEEDLCSSCLSIIFMDEDLDTHEYQHEHLTEDWLKFTSYKE